MKIKKSELKQLIKEELETTMDEGFLDRIMGRDKKDKPKSTLIYMPGKSILEFYKTGTTNLMGAVVKLFAPKGAALDPNDFSQETTIEFKFNFKDGDEFLNPRATYGARLRRKIKNAASDFLIAVPNKPGGFEKIKAEDLANKIYQDAQNQVLDDTKE
tara:strand:+ start:96 stop:569 length:474 start_codon:yes stop_codon:yes gene_type:complete